MTASRLWPIAAVAVLAGCGFNANPNTDSLSVGETAEIAVPATFTSHHLYVAQGADIASIVYRYPLRADGLPERKPDGRLDLGFRYPGSIAIGPDGDLYVSDSGTASGCKNPRKCVIDVFAPGASGHAKPIRKLFVPQPLYIAVDQRGDLDVSLLPGGNTTNVYAPNAKGEDQPINQLTSDGNLAIAASHGIAYIETYADNVEAEYEIEPSKQPIFYDYGAYEASDGVATDATHLYAQYFWLKGSEFFLATAVFKLDQPGEPIRNIIGIGCRVSFSGGALGYGLAVYKKYLYEGCIDRPGASGGVLVYDNTKNGEQHPLERLTGGNVGVAVGP
jgi:hypothetical protein